MTKTQYVRDEYLNIAANNDFNVVEIDDIFASVVNPLPRDPVKPVLMPHLDEGNQTVETVWDRNIYGIAVTPKDLKGGEQYPDWALDAARAAAGWHYALSACRERGVNPSYLFNSNEEYMNKALAWIERLSNPKFSDTVNPAKVVAAMLTIFPNLDEIDMELMDRIGKLFPDEKIVIHVQNIYSCLCSYQHGKGMKRTIFPENWKDILILTKTLLDKEKELELPPSGGMGKEDDYGEGSICDDDYYGNKEIDTGDASEDERFKDHLDYSSSKDLEEYLNSKGFHPEKGRSQRALNGDPGILWNANEPDQLPMITKRIIGHGTMSCLEGTIPKNIQRMTLDGKVFRHRLTSSGAKIRASIVIDLSGSMSFNDRDIEQLLNTLPAVSIFGYCGYDDGGRWVLLADRLQMAKSELVIRWRNHIGMGNIVDAPVLSLLAKMPAPRIWISDGEVTGVHDAPSLVVRELCNKIQDSAGIVRCGGLEAANKYLKEYVTKKFRKLEAR